MNIKKKEKEQEEDPAERRRRIIEGWKKNGLSHSEERKKTILVIDDTSEHLRAVKSLLENEYEVRVARSSEFAQGILNNIFVDLILLDIEMPEESGFEYLQRLKASPVTHHIPVIFLTSHAEQEIVAYASTLEIEGYIKKPVDPEMLKHKVYEVIHHKK